jgi:hypothetical protein
MDSVAVHVLNSEPPYTYDYEDSFVATLTAGDDRSPEQCARAVFEGAQWAVRWLLVAGFRFGLGLRLAPRSSPDHILGWEILEETADSITLQAQSWFLTSRLVFQLDELHLTQSTRVRYDRAIAAILWLPVSIIHRQIVPRLLRDAAAPHLHPGPHARG